MTCLFISTVQSTSDFSWVHYFTTQESNLPAAADNRSIFYWVEVLIQLTLHEIALFRLFLDTAKEDENSETADNKSHSETSEENKSQEKGSPQSTDTNTDIDTATKTDKKEKTGPGSETTDNS